MNKVSDITSTHDQPWRIFLVCLLGLAVVPLSCMLNGVLGFILAEALAPKYALRLISNWDIRPALHTLVTGGVVGLVQAGFSLLLFAEYIRTRRLTWCVLTFLMVVIGTSLMCARLSDNDEMLTLVIAACCGAVIGAVQISQLRVRMKTVLVWPLFMSISWFVVVGITLFILGFD